LIAPEDGVALVVKSFNNEHNYAINRVSVTTVWLVCTRFSQVTFAITGAVHATASAKKKCQLKKNKRPQSYWKVQQKAPSGQAGTK
jgi:hypothetical protein